MSTSELVMHLRATAKAWPIGGDGSLTELLEQAADEIERLRAYAANLIERLERCPEETRAIDADIAARRKAQ